MPTSPATATGYVSDDVWMQRVYTDLVEYVPDLVWPTSVATYNQMRRDPALSAILAAYTLPLRRATWNVDPTGCRPEVAQLVADDLGLPVAGMDTPGAARTRGVSWREHLRMALLHLTYGHFGFEAEADVTSGRARLVTLSERMPQTISELHVDRQGQLTGISQVQPPDNNKRRDPDVPDIPADRLVWYAHDREGAAWYGNSLLRPAFAPWLLKREMQRVFATANRRFGMGVPTGQWMPGTDPTPGQHAQLAQAVMAARVGDTSGVALPPGAFIELVGLTGSAPDTLGFMKWLDQQMSRMALAGFLDLGQTETGSRALGQSFIDLFLLNIQSIADYVADVATREIAARIVGWNWGESEPVPAVQVADVGSRREVTAESLQALLVSGALSSDPALEEYVRREWRLPERTAPALPATPVAAARPRAKRQQSGQGALFAAAGDEPDPAVDPDQAEADQHQQEWEAAVAALLVAAPVMLAPAVDDLTEQVQDRLSAGNVAALAGLVVGGVVVSALAGRLVDAMTPLTLSSAAAVAASAARQGVNVRPSKTAGGQRNRQVAKVTARLVVTGLAQSATRTALAAAGPGVDAATVAGQVRAQLDTLVAAPTGWVADQFGAVLSAAQNSGRAAVFAKVPPKLIRAVEINDRNRCGPCAEVDGTTFPTLEAALAAYPTGGYAHCAGGLRCRGFLAAEW